MIFDRIKSAALVISFAFTATLVSNSHAFDVVGALGDVPFETLTCPVQAPFLRDDLTTPVVCTLGSVEGMEAMSSAPTGDRKVLPDRPGIFQISCRCDYSLTSCKTTGKNSTSCPRGSTAPGGLPECEMEIFFETNVDFGSMIVATSSDGDDGAACRDECRNHVPDDVMKLYCQNTVTLPLSYPVGKAPCCSATEKTNAAPLLGAPRLQLPNLR